MDKERRVQKRAKDCVCPKAQVVFCQKTKVVYCRKDTGCCVSKDRSTKNVGKAISVFFPKELWHKKLNTYKTIEHMPK